MASSRRSIVLRSGEFQSGSWRPEKLSDALPHARGRLRPPMRQADRAIDWTRDNTATIVRKVRAADSAPGVLSYAARKKLLSLWRA